MTHRGRGLKSLDSPTDTLNLLNKENGGDEKDEERQDVGDSVGGHHYVFR